MDNKLDFLAFGAHPDDVELGCSGAILKIQDSGKKVGVIDLTGGSSELEVVQKLDHRKQN